MKKNPLLLKIPLLIFLGFNGICAAQQTINAAGNKAQSATGSVSYSLGQMFDQSLSSVSGKVNQGVQQPYEIYTLATNESAIQKKITVYPNPVKDFLIVDFNSEKLHNAKYQLFDGTGRIINQGELKNVKNDINTSTLNSGMFILSITSDGTKIKTFKIIKN